MWERETGERQEGTSVPKRRTEVRLVPAESHRGFPAAPLPATLLALRSSQRFLLPTDPPSLLSLLFCFFSFLHWTRSLGCPRERQDLASRFAHVIVKMVRPQDPAEYFLICLSYLDLPVEIIDCICGYLLPEPPRQDFTPVANLYDTTMLPLYPDGHPLDALSSTCSAVRSICMSRMFRTLHVSARPARDPIPPTSVWSSVR